ncbi:hypothetical protein G6F62_012749 [Rhizopus arrhizus]|nr:hypothetical protein G6F23_002275 [Rhizopus arrhizus]KAG0950179.1 hypothetical protein G6F32_005274 [Rhizopus arrhizus]KAG1300166.1 hypothetical protein G6F66_000186 [Rhizopus arrhizus]KAG1317695.1 hypothetical protein G6F62_012749 [Rhizopus arrhizus]
MDSATNKDWNLPNNTMSNFYMNEPVLFQDQKQQDISIIPPSPTMTNSSNYEPNTPPTPPHHIKSPPYSVKKTESDRKDILEKNRQAAYRCRQKKKRWVQELEEKGELAERRNKELQEQISQLREESIYLRNLLLTHGNCECRVVQEYLHHTSLQLSNRNNMIHTNSNSSNTSPLFSSQQSYM